MKSENSSTSFGRYLQAIRIEKKISLEKVSAQTRIGLGNLLLIEQEDHERLPAAVFVKGFLRSYADAIGADGDEVVRRYESRVDLVQRIAESEASMGKPVPKLWRKLTISLVLLLVIMIVSIISVKFLHGNPDTNRSAEQRISSEKVQVVVKNSQPAVELETEKEKAIPEKLSLQVTALEDTWLKIIIDDKDSNEYSLKSGDRLALEAASDYDLLIGNAGGLNILLNDTPVSIPGKSGQVVTIHLP